MSVTSPRVGSTSSSDRRSPSTNCASAARRAGRRRGVAEADGELACVRPHAALHRSARRARRTTMRRSRPMITIASLMPPRTSAEIVVVSGWSSLIWGSGAVVDVRQLLLESPELLLQPSSQLVGRLAALAPVTGSPLAPRPLYASRPPAHRGSAGSPWPAHQLVLQAPSADLFVDALPPTTASSPTSWASPASAAARGQARGTSARSRSARVTGINLISTTRSALLRQPRDRPAPALGRAFASCSAWRSSRTCRSGRACRGTLKLGAPALSRACGCCRRPPCRSLDHEHPGGLVELEDFPFRQRGQVLPPSAGRRSQGTASCLATARRTELQAPLIEANTFSLLASVRFLRRRAKAARTARRSRSCWKGRPAGRKQG